MKAFFLWLSLILAAVSRVAAGADPQVIFRKASPSVVKVLWVDSAKRVIQGSGVFISADGDIITNNHVVEGTSSVVVELSDQRQFTGTVTLRDATHDLAIIKVKVTTASVALVAVDKRPDTGARVYAIGSPEGLLNTISDGLVSGQDVYSGHDVLPISVPISHGSSGGALVNENGELVGITEGVIKDGQNLNFAVPADYVSATLRRAGVPAPGQAPRAGSIDTAAEEEGAARTLKIVTDLRLKELLNSAAENMKNGKNDQAIGDVGALFRLKQGGMEVKDNERIALSQDRYAMKSPWSDKATVVDDGLQVLNISLKKKGIASLYDADRVAQNSQVDFGAYIEDVWIDRPNSNWVLFVTQSPGQTTCVCVSGKALNDVAIMPSTLVGKVVEIRGTSGGHPGLLVGNRHQIMDALRVTLKDAKDLRVLAE